jgi:hypothetical protein
MTAPTPPAIRYPAGPITPHGAYYLAEDAIPTVKLRAYDNSISFALMGGESICDRTMPERVDIKDLKGLVPPWKQIKQKGATQDGETFVTSLYDPCMVEMLAVAHGRNPAHTRQVVSRLVASIDAIQTSELSWYTQAMGRWWSLVRWFAPHADNLAAIRNNRQPLSLRLLAYDAFWRSYDYVRQFGFGYTAAQDTFSTDQGSGLGSGWTVALSGSGTGGLTVNGNLTTDNGGFGGPGNGQVVPTLQNNKTAVSRRVGYTSATDNQVIELDLGSFPQWFFDDTTFVDFWPRMLNTGTPGTDGLRMRLGASTITLSSFTSGVETVLRQAPLTIPPKAGEANWTCVAGYPANARQYTLLRNGAAVFTFTESGATSHIGAGYRSSGFGLSTGSSAVPPGVRRVSFGDNSTQSQSGFVQMVNAGDQPMWPRFTCFGPGTFVFGDGPSATNFVEFGPVLANQAVQIRTDPRKAGVVDLTSNPATPQDFNVWLTALQDITSFFSAPSVGGFRGLATELQTLTAIEILSVIAQGGATPPLLTTLQSYFGVVPPQGDLYSLLDGRFSQPTPPKSPGNPCVPYQIPVAIENGNASSLIVAAGTPLRRLPY